MSKPFNYVEPKWEPLERAVRLAGLSLAVCGDFMWMCEQPEGTHQYKHRDTRRYANLRIDTPRSAAINEVGAARFCGALNCELKGHSNA